MSKNFIDLRSDTVTTPTAEMRRAMHDAQVGDDVYGEDPTVNRLEEKAAQMLGKERALFVPTGTMGNQIAILTHTNPGEEVILEQDCHIFYYELGGLARLGGLQARTIKGERGVLQPKAVKEAIRGADLHFPRTGLICTENTHNRMGGAVVSPEQTAELKRIVEEFGIPIHLDGARIFNAAAYLGVNVRELVKDVDSVMFSLSKGLAAPVGSILAGTDSFILEAKKWRKMLGGGMRQAGVIAAAGEVALDTMVDRLKVDHQMAKLLAEKISQLPKIKIDLNSVQTNIIVINIKAMDINAVQFLQMLEERGVKATPFGEYLVRMVTHKDITWDDIEKSYEAIASMVEC